MEIVIDETVAGNLVKKRILWNFKNKFNKLQILEEFIWKTADTDFRMG